MNYKFALKILLIIISALAGGALSTQFFSVYSIQAKTSKDTISAQGFRLVDSKGRQRAFLRNAGKAEDATFFSIYDSRGKERVAIVIDQWGKTHPKTFIEFKDVNEKKRMELSVDADGAPFIRFWDSKKKLKAVLPGGRASTHTLKPIKKIGAAGGKDKSLDDIRYLQGQIDTLRKKLDDLIDRTNDLSQ